MQDDLAVCQACFAQLCKDHRVAPYTPKGAALAKGRSSVYSAEDVTEPIVL